MSKIFSRKFMLLFATYIAFVVFFALGMLSERWFCGSLLALSLFYFIANVWQKSIVKFEPDMKEWEKRFQDLVSKKKAE